MAVTISDLQATDVPTNIGSRRSITGTRRIGVDLALDSFVKLGDNLTTCSDEIDAERWLQLGRARGEAEEGIESGNVLPDAQHVDGRDRAQRGAHAVLALHPADADSFCSGCLDLARLAPVPCPERLAALSEVETHGVAMWDTPTRLVEAFALTSFPTAVGALGPN